MTQLMIGGILREVPTGYLVLETEYTEKEMADFTAAIDYDTKESCRSLVLEKRLHFYQDYLAGKVIIPCTSTKVNGTVTIFERFDNWLYGWLRK